VAMTRGQGDIESRVPQHYLARRISAQQFAILS